MVGGLLLYKHISSFIICRYLWEGNIEEDQECYMVSICAFKWYI